MLAAHASDTSKYAWQYCYNFRQCEIISFKITVINAVLKRFLVTSIAEHLAQSSEIKIKIFALIIKAGEKMENPPNYVTMVWIQLMETYTNSLYLQCHCNSLFLTCKNDPSLPFQSPTIRSLFK